MSNGRAIGRLNGLKHRVPVTNSFEHRLIWNRMLCDRLGTFPEHPTLRREDQKRMGDLL
jgi:hypothetical protein